MNKWNSYLSNTESNSTVVFQMLRKCRILVDSGYNPIKPNYMKPDTDDDGFDDNVEVDVELTKVEVPGKQGNPSTSNICL